MANEFDPIIDQAAKKHGVDPEVIRAIIRQESAGDSSAISNKGAQGLMQLMPGTAKELGVTDSLDPFQNIMAGTKYFKQQLDRFGSRDLALAAYNAGPGAVRKHGGIPPFTETQDYVKRITAKIRGMGTGDISMANEFDMLNDLISQPISDPADLVRGRRRQLGRRKLGTEEAFARFERPESRFQQIAGPAEDILSGLALIADLTSGKRRVRREAPEKFARLQEGRTLRKERRKAERREELQATLSQQDIEAGLQDQLFNAIAVGEQQKMTSAQRRIENRIRREQLKLQERRVETEEKRASKAGEPKEPTPAEKADATLQAGYKMLDAVQRTHGYTLEQGMAWLKVNNFPMYNAVNKASGGIELPEDVMKNIDIEVNEEISKQFKDNLQFAHLEYAEAKTDDEREEAEEKLNVIIEAMELTGIGLRRRKILAHGIGPDEPSDIPPEPDDYWGNLLKGGGVSPDEGFDIDALFKANLQRLTGGARP